MPSDLTIAEKAEKLGLGRCYHPMCEGWRWPAALCCMTEDAVAALYAERFPSEPDYRAALAALERVGTRLVEEWNNINVDGPRGFADVQASIEDMTAALTHARKVLHGQ